MSERDGVRPEWKRRALWWTVAGTVFLLVSGLVVLLAPFGPGPQISVVVHTLLGLVWLVPVLWYLVPHFVQRWRDRWSHFLLLGWLAGLTILAVALSGVVLTVQAAFARRIDYAWDLVHIVTGCALGAFIVLHLVTSVRRHYEGEAAHVKRALFGSSVAGLLVALACWGGGVVVSEPARRVALPENYSLRYGDNPFAPSLARTDLLWKLHEARRWLAFLEEYRPSETAAFLRTVDAYPDWADTLRAGRQDELLTEVRETIRVTEATYSSDGGLAPESLAGSRTCGTTGCHEEILAEWQPSAHRYASRSVFFQHIQGAMADANGAESTRYCAGCHDPISLFSGAKNVFHDDLSGPGADEGISCAVCHSMVRTDVQGNANYVLQPPRRYLAEDAFLGRFLIRAYPRHHKESFGRPLLKTPEFCGACHKQFIDREINRATRVQLQNQYDAWKGSHWFVPDPETGQADPEKSLTCSDCHMRLVASDDPGADGQHRHHGTIAANQWLPLFHDLPHAEEHVRLTEEWLRGETVIPEIADRWPGGPPIPIRIEAPEKVRPGEKVKLRVVADNRKVGHSFPTGPLDVIQAWVEVRVTCGGKEVYASGQLDRDGFLTPGTWIFKAEGVDRAGNLIDRHNLWDMVGARFRRVLFPGYSDQQEYDFVWNCETATGIATPDVEFVAPKGDDMLHVHAVLRYRKVDQTLLNVLRPDGKARAPVTDMSHAEARIRILK